MWCCPRAGFGLVNYKLTSTWAEHCPAYYLAISLEQKQVIISIRGTAQVEDVITDLTALPAVRAPAHTRRYFYASSCLLLEESGGRMHTCAQPPAQQEVFCPFFHDADRRGCRMSCSLPGSASRLSACGCRNLGRRSSWSTVASSPLQTGSMTGCTALHW